MRRELLPLGLALPPQEPSFPLLRLVYFVLALVLFQNGSPQLVPSACQLHSRSNLRFACLTAPEQKEYRISVAVFLFEQVDEGQYRRQLQAIGCVLPASSAEWCLPACY